MKRSIYQERRIKEIRKKAKTLYKQGLTLREVGSAVGKSHEWVRKVVEVLDKN